MNTQEMEGRFRSFTFGVIWNLLLLTVGSALIAFAVKSIAMPAGMLSGGMSGLALLCYYIFGGLSTGQWYFLLNVPLFILGWILVSRRFLFYSLYGMAAVAVFIDIIPWTLTLKDPWLAVVAGGAILGAGVGITLRSLGSTGGSDILAVIFKEKFNLSMGAFEFWFNAIVFVGGFAFLPLDIMLYSLTMTFVISMAIEYVMGMFSERKMVLVISNKPQEIVDLILKKLDRGATILEGKGGYTGENKEVILTMVSSIQLKYLEEIIYSVDPEAFTIMGSGYHVLGSGFSSRKVY